MIRPRKLLSKYTQKIRQTAFNDEKIFKVKQFYVVYVPRKMRKLEVPEKTLFCEIEAFSMQIMVPAVISKIGKFSNFFVEPNTKLSAKYYCNVLLKKMIA